MTAAAFGLALAALILLALSLPRHASQVGVARAGWRLRGGWAMLSLSLVMTLAQSGWRIALVEWIGGVGTGAAIVMLLLTYAPRTVPRLAPVLVTLSVLGGLWSVSRL